MTHYLPAVSASADHEIVERYRGGFVGKFMTHQKCVTWPYSRLLYRKVPNSCTARLCIELSDVFSLPEHDNGAMIVRWPFDFSAYLSEDGNGRKRRMLDAVHSVCLWCADSRGWPVAPFKAARESLLQNGFQHLFLSKKTLPVDGLGCRARIGVRFDLESMEFFAVLPRRIFPPSLVRLGSHNQPHEGYEDQLASYATLLYRDGCLTLRTPRGESSVPFDGRSG